MSDLNEVVISGRLTRDAELRQTPNGTAVTDIIVASNRIWSKDSDKQEEATFVDVTIWGKQAESLAKYLTKGRHVMLTGRLKLNKWETEEGDRRSKLTVVAEKVNLTPGGTPGGNGYSSESATSKPKKKQQVEEEVPF
jgi:single-strand DNA-binding protein|tara:strand:+ start:39275 stop:39688 length:414 start_codon:yes stop_codon:yes gene_type:complete